MKKSHFMVGQLVAIRITRYGFVKGEILTVVDPIKRGKEQAIIVTARGKVARVPSKNLEDI